MRRWLRRSSTSPTGEVEVETGPVEAGCGAPRRTPGIVGDDVPRGWIVPPVAVASIEALPAERSDDGQLRVTFFVNVRDAAGQRCPDLLVDAHVDGPERGGPGSAHTDEFGQVRFRMTGPPGRYACEITGIGAGGLEVARGDDGVIAAAVTEVVR